VRYVENGGRPISVIGVGTWQFGSREWGYGSDYAEHEAVEIVHRALDLGVNLVDTAEIYGFGASERIVGRALAGRREQAYVATKVFPVVPLAPVVVNRGRASASRLGIDRIDLYQQHWPNPVVGVGQSMDGMRRLQEDGVIDDVGVSNFSADQWAAADAALGAPVRTNQVEYNLVNRRPERAVLPYAREHDRVVIAYSPLAQGFLGGRYDEDNRPGGLRANRTLFLRENLRRGRELIETLRRVARSHDATPSQVALAWVIHQPNVVAIPGASSVAQLESNVEAAELELTDDEHAELTAASDRFDPVRGAEAARQLLRQRLPG
jgi:aryl-alcohol dehydrogenase-like predicted oxidoreductase